MFKYTTSVHKDIKRFTRTDEESAFFLYHEVTWAVFSSLQNLNWSTVNFKCVYKWPNQNPWGSILRFVSSPIHLPSLWLLDEYLKEQKLNLKKECRLRTRVLMEYILKTTGLAAGASKSNLDSYQIHTNFPSTLPYFLASLISTTW